VFILLMTAFFLSQACQTTSKPRVSLEDAKKITADLYQPQMEIRVPPRTVDDLFQAMDAQAASNDWLLAGFVDAIRQPAPVTDNKTTLYKHYIRKAEAARLLGRYEDALAAARQALTVAPSGKTRYFAYFSIATALDELGKLQAVLDVYTQARTTGADPVGYYPFLALFKAQVGDFKGAQADIATARGALSRIDRGHPKRSHLNRIFWMCAGTIHYLQGDYPAAERILKMALAEANRNIAALGPQAKGRFSDQRVPDLTGRTKAESAYLTKTYVLRKLSLTVMRQQRLAEAEALARETVLIQARVFGRYSGQVVEGLRALSWILAEQQRIDDVRRLVTEQLAIYRKMGVERGSTNLAVTQRILADVLVVQGRLVAAQTHYDRLAADLAQRPETLAAVLSENLNWAIPAIALERSDRAEILLRQVHAKLAARAGESHYLAAEARGFLAAALAARGKYQAALKAFKETLPVLFERDSQSERAAGSSSGRLFRRTFVVESYLALLADYDATGRKLPAGTDLQAEIFQVAGLAYRSTVRQALAASAARAAITDSELAALARREQDALFRIKALNRLIIGAEIDSAMRSDLQQRIHNLKTSRRVIMAELNRRFPTYAELIDPIPMTLADVAAYLQPDEALLVIYTARDSTYVWAVPKTGRPVFQATDLAFREAGRIAEQLRQALDPPDIQTLGDIPDYDVALAHGLFAKLLAPVASGWQPARRLAFVVNGPLGSLPFTLLPVEAASVAGDRTLLFDRYAEVSWLVKKYAVSVLPSVDALRMLRTTPESSLARRPFLGFGDPVFAKLEPPQATPHQPAAAPFSARGLPLQRRNLLRGIQLNEKRFGLADLPRLPETAGEIKAVAASLSADFKQDVFLGAAANEQQVKQMSRSGTLAGYRVISFATHGLLPGDLDGLTQPALALSHPDRAGIDGDGLLTMEEVLGLKTQADWVILSACNTAAAQGRGTEAVSGLGQAFFYAGTRALLVSSWPVHSAATRELMVALFKRQAEQPALARSAALQQTMAAMIANGAFKDTSGQAAFSYAHPIFWAPFSLVGDGGAS
jgi:CHAT domain-containing protein